ncbi:Inositol-3-phosphate synthase [uncultured Desulfobacterium sp.]|uniref:Inositol-3-phosphate synthase n=1 Tax=uncultured Desulfobacterium sp. TaxID=201089 RepID=A0A445N179_9BACT|nr:Inositol-3-phosphate synthase [uncultured Desulfobacterium sp.]
MKQAKTGVWLIGALGSVAATVILGATALRRGLVSSTGLITYTKEFDKLGLVDIGEMEFGGCDIRKGDLLKSLRLLSGECKAIDRRTLDTLEKDLEQTGKYISSGSIRNCGQAIEGLSNIADNNCKCLRDEIKEIRGAIQRFRDEKNLDRVVVVNLASTEPLLDLTYCHGDLNGFENSLDENDTSSVRASTLYAYAAIQEGCPYINFTPSNGALIPAIVQLAELKGVPVMGNDGKTGETLIKSALAPMFAYRALDILSWQGYNILGNMDGQVLNHPENRESKIRSKDQTLSKILGYTPHSRVGIDYVPSLGDQKTAWDFIHFRGFMGATMSLQFIWQGYDSILAAPLVLDMVRLAEFAKRRGEAGLMPQLAVFFKSPVGVNEHRLSEQYHMLKNYVKEVNKNPEKLKMIK